jgi:hypothetical protein
MGAEMLILLLAATVFLINPHFVVIANVDEGRGGIDYSVPDLGDTAMMPQSQGCIKLARSSSAIAMAEKGLPRFPYRRGGAGLARKT